MPLENETSGIIYGSASAILFAIMAISSQQLPANISASEISTFRGLFTAIALLPVVFFDLKILFNLKTTRSIWIRSISGGIAVISYFFNLEHTSAANAKALSNTNPLYVAIFAFFINKERLSKLELTGLIVLIYGTFLLAWDMNQDGSKTQWFVGSIGSVFTAAAYLSLKRASGKFSPELIVFSFGLAVAFVSPFVPGQWSIPNAEQLFWLFIVGATGLGGQIYLTYSYIHLKNSVASALTLLQSLLLIGYDIAWSGRLIPGVGLWANTLILFGMMLMVVWRNKQASIQYSSVSKT